MATTYYIDNLHGDNGNDALTPIQAITNYRLLCPAPGDTILFAKGCCFRDDLVMTEGTAASPILYGSYGKGGLPRFYGSDSLNGADNWEEAASHIWRYTQPLKDEVCNLIFDYDKECGNLCWEKEALSRQGDWYYNRLGITESPGCSYDLEEPSALYLYSSENPGSWYQDIECAFHGTRSLLKGKKHVVVQDLAFWCGGVHGYGETLPEDVIIRGCEFRFIGGCVWNRDLKIRFGNGVELWDGGIDILVEHCFFDNIYDSCVTHQGSADHIIPEHICWRNNRFQNFGMAAFEYREYNGRDIVFEKNICLDAGLGFSLQNETPPRKSEIWPQPMGHHLFIWNIEEGVPSGSILIQDNLFSGSPYGAALYSIVSPEAEAQIIMKNNRYYKAADDLWVHFGGKSYGRSEFAVYQRETGQDEGSVLLMERAEQ